MTPRQLTDVELTRAVERAARHLATAAEVRRVAPEAAPVEVALAVEHRLAELRRELVRRRLPRQD